MDAIHKQNAYIIINHLNSALIAENNTDNTSNIARRTTSKLSKFMREFKTKEDVIGTVIKSTSVKQGALIIGFYEKLGVPNKLKYNGDSKDVYYGTRTGCTIEMFYSMPEGYKRIRPRLVPKYVPKQRFPRTMWVSDSKEIWTKAVVVAKINKFERKYIAAMNGVDELDTKYHGFRYAKEINK